jgi:hypothetical protein
MSAATTNVKFTEDVYGGAIAIDREAGVIKNVKILGRESKNGRLYSQSAMESAAKLYADCDVCIDHPSDSGVDRSIRDSVAVIKQTRVTSEGVFGDLHYLKSHPDAEAIVERAERFPQSFGLSHNAYGSTKPNPSGDGPEIVESIEYVESVDIVRRPATSRGLFESQQQRKEKPVAKKKVKDLLAEQKKSGEAKRLLKLLEMENMPAEMATAEVASEGSAEDQLKASIKAMVNAVLDDEDTDNAGKLAKIRQILNVQDRVLDNGSPGKPEESSEEVAESNKQLAQLRREMQVRDLLESHGLSWATLSKDRRAVLSKVSDPDVAAALVESWKPAAEPDQDDTPRKPAIRPMRESFDPGASSYEDLLEEAKSKY